MMYPAPSMSFFMGGEEFNDSISVVTVVFGGGAVNDGNWPGYNVPATVAGPDTNEESVETVPPTLRFMADADKPNSIGDYPCRQCAASGHWGAPHAMVSVDGRWYLRTYAPDPRSAKRYPPRGGVG